VRSDTGCLLFPVSKIAIFPRRTDVPSRDSRQIWSPGLNDVGGVHDTALSRP
jgi:hypothetical protein